MAKVKKVSSLVKLSMTILILTALPITVAAFNNIRYRGSQASSTPPGSKLPNGAHYNLNVIGVPKGKNTSMSGGNRLFVPLTGKTQVNLTNGEYSVTDANGTDGAAAFQLPNPDLDKDGTTDYSVWVKALGKPSGQSAMNSCADDPVNGEMFCSVNQMLSVRSSGKQTLVDVTRDLLYVYVDLNSDGTGERYPLFDDALQNYFWNYDNQGMKLLQIRFYELPSTTFSSK